MSDGKRIIRLNVTQTICYNSDCLKRFTEERRGQVCSACHNSVYCDAKCQKAAWPLHKKQCAINRRHQQAQEAFVAEHRPESDMGKDLSFYVGSSTHVVGVVARSALRLGRPDSLAMSHFLFLTLEYTTPPASRVALSKSGKIVGDERDFFKYKKAEVLPDSCLDEGEFRGRGFSKADKQDSCRRKMGKEPGKVGFFAVLLAIRASTGERVMSDVYVGYPLYDPLHLIHCIDRQLNPTWKAMLVLDDIFTRVPPNTMEEKSVLERADLAMSEDLKLLQGLPHQPPLGWAMVKQWVANLVAGSTLK